MASSSYNPLSYTKKLQESGLSKETSDTIAQEQAQIVSLLINNELATKTDIKEIKKDIISLEIKMNAMEVSLIKWMVGLSFGQLAIIFAILNFSSKVIVH